MSRRRRQQRLERVLGTPALFSTAYGNVGSSIYYALGVTAVFALGLTPLVFVIAGLIFAATAATYAEGTVRSEEHTSELQSHSDLVCRLLLEKKKKKKTRRRAYRSTPTICSEARHRKPT